MVIWFTGISGAGKTTLCAELYQRLKPAMPELVLLDGDAVRAALGGDLGYTEADRVVQISRVQRMAKLLSDQGLCVMVAVVYANPDLLKWNREQIKDYVEIYLRVSMDTVKRRDPKGIYARATDGLTSNVVGIDIPWHEPVDSDLVLDADAGDPPHVMAERVLAAVPALRKDGRR